MKNILTFSVLAFTAITISAQTPERTPMKSLPKMQTKMRSQTKAVPLETIPADVVAGNIDRTADPRQDFFQYANGGWLKAHPIPASESSWGIGNVIYEDLYLKKRKINEKAVAENAAKGTNAQKIADFWTTAMDTDAIERQGLTPLLPFLDQIDAINDVRSVLDAAALLQTYNIDALFGSGVSQDEKNSEVYSYHLGQGGIGMPNRDYYVNTDARTVKIREGYTQYVTNIFKLSGDNDADAAKHSAAVMRLETGLAKASRKLEDLRDPYKNYNKKSLAELQRMTPSLSWAALMKKMEVPALDSVVVGQPEFFDQVEQSLKMTPIADWKAYLKWTLINAFASRLPKNIETESFHFYRTVLSGVKEPKPRWKRALDAQENALGDALGELFVKKYFSEAAKKRYSDMTDNVLAAFRERLQTLPWASEATKAKALVKLDKVMKKVGYPEKFKDFSAMQIGRSSYAANSMSAAQWKYFYDLNKLGKPVDRTEWGMTPQTYNAYYNPSNNEIVLPAAQFLIPGFPDEQVDDAVAYGYSAASTIGHEITHGFDDEGRQFDEKGNLNNWWTPTDEAEFNKRAQVMVDQFNNYVALDTMHVRGQACLGENIADLGGIILGYRAFQKTDQYQAGKKIAGFTPPQRFFLGYALGWLHQQRPENLARQIMTDVHAPANLRVNGPFANVPEFYEAFGVKPGDAMYRGTDIRVHIW